MFNRGKNRVVLFAAFVCMALVGEGAFAKPKSELVKEESGYYYGYGKGATTEEADFLAKRDLIENALTSTLRITNPEAGKISISDDLVAKRLTDVKAYTQSKNGLSVTYRVRVSEWERDEKAYAAKLRTSLSSRYNTLIGKGSIASRIDSAISILNELAENGETDLLTVQEKGSELYSLKVEDLCSSLISELTYSFSVKDSIINILKFLINPLASIILCFSPPDKLNPFSSINVLYPKFLSNILDFLAFSITLASFFK